MFGHDNLSRLAVFVRVESPRSIVDLLDRLVFGLPPTAAIGINASDMRNPLMRICPISFSHTPNPSPVRHDGAPLFSARAGIDLGARVRFTDLVFYTALPCNRLVTLRGGNRERPLSSNDARWLPDSWLQILHVESWDLVKV